VASLDEEKPVKSFKLWVAKTVFSAAFLLPILTQISK
jgi:hypothetical protein